MNGGWAQAAKGALEFSRRQSGQTGEGGAPGESGARAARGASGVQALGMLALFEAKREREKRLGLARDASVSSEHERKLATLPSWMLTLEKTALREAWARWLNNKAAADSVKAWVRECTPCSFSGPSVNPGTHLSPNPHHHPPPTVRNKERTNNPVAIRD